MNYSRSLTGSAAILAALLLLSSNTFASNRLNGGPDFSDSFCRAVDGRLSTDKSAVVVYNSRRAYTIDVSGLTAEVPRSSSVVIIGPAHWINLRTGEIVKDGVRSRIQFEVDDPHALIKSDSAPDLTATEILQTALSINSYTESTTKVPFIVPIIFRTSGSTITVLSLSGFLDIETKKLVVEDVSLPDETTWFFDENARVFGRLDYGFNSASPELSSPAFRFREAGTSEWNEPFTVQISPNFFEPVRAARNEMIAIGRMQNDTAYLGRFRPDGSQISELWADDVYDVAEATYNKTLGNIFIQIADSEGSQFLNGEEVMDRRILYYDFGSDLEISATENVEGMNVSVIRDGRTIQEFPVACNSLVRIEAETNEPDGAAARFHYLTRPNPTGRGDMILTLPIGSQVRGLIAEIKGGPFTHDQVGQNDETLWLTSQGFAVLQINYSGSSGRGGAFERSAFSDNGESAGDDVIEAIKWAQSYLGIRPAQTGVVASSYGGLLAVRDVLPAGIATAAWALKYPAFDYPYSRYRLAVEPAINTIDESIILWCSDHHTDAERQRITMFVGENDRVIEPATAGKFKTACEQKVDAEIVVLPGTGHGAGMNFSPDLKAGMSRLFGRL